MGNTFGNLVAFTKQAYFSGKPQWGINDIPDLTGKVAIVTGGYSGLGEITVKALLLHNATVYIAGRDRQKSEAKIQELEAATQKKAHFLELDLAKLNSVKQAANDFLSKEKRLHMLFNNGGVMMPPVSETTADGYDLCFGVNVLGHFYLTKLLLPIMISTASETGEKVRVVTTSSASHYLAMYDFNAFKDGPVRRKLSLMDLYGQSKWGNVVFANELARRYGDQGIVSTAVNPGNLKTDLSRYVHGGVEGFLLRILQIYPAEWGALTQLYAATSPEGANFNGEFLVPWAQLGKARTDTKDPKLGNDLWTWLEDQVKDL